MPLPTKPARKLILAAAQLLCCSAVVMAQFSNVNPRFVHRSWTAEDGLPQNTVTAIARTNDGYVWFGTVKGVVRFDGVRFTAFERAATPGLVGDRVTELLAAKSGDLWIGTEWGGVGRYSDGAFINHHSEGAVAEQYISGLFEDGNGHVWIGAPTAAYRYDGESFERFPFGRPGSREAPQAFLETRDGRLLAAGAGLYLFTGAGFDKIQVNGLAEKVGVYDMREAADASLWLATTQGIVHSGLESARTFSFEDPVTTLIIGDDGLPWAGARRQGLVRFDGHEWIVELPLGFIRDLLLDHDDLLWVAGGDDGLHRLQPALFRSVAKVGAPGGESVLRVAEDKEGGIWTGSLYAGMFRVHDGEVRRFTSEDGLPHNAAYMVTGDREGEIWTGVGVRLLRFTGGRFEPVPFGQEGTLDTSAPIRAIERSRHGGLWLAMPGLIARFDGHELTDLVDVPEHRGLQPTHLEEDSSGDLWLAADRGVLCHIADGISNCLGAPEGIPPYVVRDVHKNPDGSYWFGTYGGGLCRLSENVARCIGPAEGLPDNTVHEIFEDEYGYVWLSSNRGVSRARRSELEAVFDGSISQVAPDTYGLADGMPSSECNEGGLQASDGRLWFPTIRGLTYVDPKDALAYRSGSARTYLERILVDGSPTEIADKVEIPPGSDRVTFEFTGVYFRAPEKLRFRSKLNGHDQHWIASGSNRSATYTNLSPGTYSFQVQSAVGSGDWSSPAEVRIRLAPFFYETWGFRVAALLGLLALGASLYRYRVSRLLVRERLRNSEAETKRLAELDAAKSRFFANISHEFRTPLTLIISPVTDVLDKGGLSPADERRYRLVLSNAQRLLRLINQLLDLSRLDAGRFSLDRKESDFVRFIDGLVRTFQPLAERNGISLKFRTHLTTFLTAFDENVISGIINNLLSNALKFTPSGGKVWVTLTRQGDDFVEVVVKDTGPGIPRIALSRIFDRFEQVDNIVGTDAFGSGIGLALAKELTELHGGVLLVESEEGFGSAFIARFMLTPVAPGTGVDRQPSLPAQTNNDGGEMNVSSSFERAHSPTNPTVLVIDDNAEVRSVIIELLGSDFNVIQAGDGTEGLEAALTAEPELVLTDLMMPGLDGIELCKRIRSEARLAHVPIILLTAKAGDGATLDGLAAGADDYVVKPFHAATLRAKALNLIESRRSMRDRFRQELVLPGADIVVSSDDEAFARQLLAVIDDRMACPSFNVSVLADEVGLSRRQLTRRAKAVIGMPPSELILRRRLDKASRLLVAKAGTISEIAYQVGFKSPSHFGSVFRNTFGHSPTEHVRSGT